MPIRVVFVDDDETFHHVVAALLRSADDVALVGQGYRGEDAIALCRSVEPDIILMDVRMPGMSGIEAAREILRDYPAVKILAFSSFREVEEVRAMLDNGAVGYIAKGSEADDLLATIRLTHKGMSILAQEAMQALVSGPNEPLSDFNLTDREMEVLKLIATGMNNREAAYALGVSVATVRFHIVNIQEKLGVESRSEVLIVAAKHHLI